MTTSTFNAIQYSKKLKDAGMNGTLADLQAEEISNLLDSIVLKKGDLREFELRMTIKLGSMMIVQTGIIMTVIGFIFKHA